MRAVWGLLAGLLLVAAPAGAHIRPNYNGWDVGDLRSFGLSCDASTDDRAALAAVLATGGAGAGATVRLPSGCKVLIGSPGAGASAVDLAANTTIECEDATAGFVLAGRYCDASSTFPDAACTEDADCLPNPGGSCVYDGDASASFAPVAGSAYTLFAAETDATGLGLSGCSIWTQHDNGRPLAVGGSGIRHGYCDGAGTSDAGQACGEFCNSSAGVLEGIQCTGATAAALCGNASWCTLGDSTCTDAGGACDEAPYLTAWGVSGAGDIQIVNWGDLSTVEDVEIIDHRMGAFSITMGTHALVRRVDNSVDGLEEPQVADADWFNFSREASVKTGVIVGFSSLIEAVTSRAWDVAFSIGGSAKIHDSRALPLGDITASGAGADDWKGTVGVSIDGSETIVTNNHMATFIGILPSTGNFIASNNRIQGGAGPKVVAFGAGNQYENNYFAWGSVGSVVSMGDPRGYCDAGPRQDELCLSDAGQNADYGCPFACSESATKACVPRCDASATNEGVMCDADADCPSGTCDDDYDCTGTCTVGVTYVCDPDADFVNVGGTNHLVVTGNIIHSDLSTRTTTTGDKREGVKFLGFSEDGRCDVDSDEYGEACDADVDCTNGACTENFIHSHGTFEGNIFYNGADSTAVEFPVAGVAQLVGFKFDNHYQGFEEGFVFPASPAYTIDRLELSGLMSGVTTPLVNWDWSYGDTSGMVGLTPVDDQAQVVTLTAGETITKGMAVTASGATDLNIVKAANSNAERAVGVALETMSATNSARIATSGKMSCLAGGTVSRQDLLKIDTSDPGKFVSGSTGDVILGVALEAGTDGNEFDCMFNGPGANDSSTYPKFARAEDASTIWSGSATPTCTTSEDEVVKLASYSTGSSTNVVISAQATFLKTGGSGEAVLEMTLYDGGSTLGDCDAGGGTVVGQKVLFEVPSGEADSGGVTMHGQWFDTGDNAAHTYRICYCNSGSSWSGITVSNGSIFLTEYQ